MASRENREDSQSTDPAHGQSVHSVDNEKKNENEQKMNDEQETINVWASAWKHRIHPCTHSSKKMHRNYCNYPCTH